MLMIAAVSGCLVEITAMLIKLWLSFLDNKHIFNSLAADKIYLLAGNSTGFYKVLNFL